MKAQALPSPIKVFIYYMHTDIQYANEIRQVLSGNVDWELIPDILTKEMPEWGELWEEQLNQGDVFVVLISNAFMPSLDNMEELYRILERLEKGEIYIVPIVLDDCNPEKLAIRKYHLLSENTVPFTQLSEKETLFGELVDRISKIARLRRNTRVVDLLAQNRLTRATDLRLFKCGLDHIPFDLLSMPWITHLSLAQNDISEIENLANLPELVHLNLSINRIDRLVNLSEVSNLLYLDLEQNQLTELGGVEVLSKLQTLGISSNQIHDFASLAHLPRLKTLYLARNGIEELRNLDTAVSLERVVLSDNRIVSLKPLIGLIRKGIPIIHDRYSFDPQEKGIFVKGNQISDPPIDIIQLGRDAILDHYEKLEAQGMEKLEILKVILIGNSGVGKTNFSQLLRGESLNSGHVSTHVMDIKPWKARFLKSPNGEPMLVNLFDFGGQDYYHDLHQLYYSHDTAYVLLWDTSTNFYDEVPQHLDAQTTIWFEHYPVNYWLESIWHCLNGKGSYDYKEEVETPGSVPANAQYDAPDLSRSAPVLILQNKIDESKNGYPAEGLLDQLSLQKKYPNISTFYNLSLQPGLRLGALDEVLHTCFGKLNLSGRLLTRPRHEVITAYIHSETGFEVQTIEEFKKTCQSLLRNNAVTLDNEDTRAIASVLTNLGYVYFDPAPEGVETADEVVFTRLDTLNELIKQVMDVARRQHNRGVVHYDQFAHIQSVTHVLPLLTKNHSLILLKDQEYLAPQFLPVETDEKIRLFLPLFGYCNLRYVYTAYFHKSLLMRIFHGFIRLSEEGDRKSYTTVRYYYWRRGLTLSEEIRDSTGQIIRSQSVFVHLIKEKDQCSIEIRTLLPFDREAGLEGKVEALLDELNKGWTVEKEVSLDSHHYFSVSELLARAAKKIYGFRENGRDYSLHDFKYWVSIPNLPKKLFISYSSKNAAFMLRLATHLEVLRIGGQLVPWYDRKIEPGSQWDEAIKRELDGSDIIVLLLSPDFLATDYIRTVEIPMAIEHARKTGCRLFSVEVQSCSWEETELRSFQQNLKSGIPGKETIVINQADMDGEWKKIVGKLKEVLG